MLVGGGDEGGEGGREGCMIIYVEGGRLVDVFSVVRLERSSE